MECIFFGRPIFVPSIPAGMGADTILAAENGRKGFFLASLRAWNWTHETRGLIKKA